MPPYPPPENERPLLDAVAEGDQQAFRQLVEGHWSRVYGNTLALVRSAAAAQELTQDIFMKIWTQREKLTAVTSFKYYIYVLGRNQVISAMRKKVKETISVDEAHAVEDLLMPDLQLEFKETYRLVQQGIERLSPQQRLIFTMSRIEGLSHEEIAHRLSLSKNTVKVHMVLALNSLRTYIKDNLPALLILLLFSFRS